MKRDPDFPNLPYIPDHVRCLWSEDEKSARHCQEIEENATGRAKAVPWMNRHHLSELVEMQLAARQAKAADAVSSRRR